MPSEEEWYGHNVKTGAKGKFPASYVDTAKSSPEALAAMESSFLVKKGAAPMATIAGAATGASEVAAPAPSAGMESVAAKPAVVLGGTETSKVSSKKPAAKKEKKPVLLDSEGKEIKKNQTAYFSSKPRSARPPPPRSRPPSPPVRRPASRWSSWRVRWQSASERCGKP